MKINLKRRINWLRGVLFVAAVAIIVLMLPRPDRAAYTYEMNQPWKYALLTAPFDMPQLRDSMTVRALRDSVDAHFVPLVMTDRATVRDNMAMFKMSIHGQVSAQAEALLMSALGRVYERGIISRKFQDDINRRGLKNLRTTETDGNPNTIASIPVSQLLTPGQAFDYIDSTYIAANKRSKDAGLPAEVSHALNQCIAQSLVIDTVADHKFRNQEYLNVSAAQGIIKQGQRIVDRGEIVTPQIYTNLRTYEEMLNQQSDQYDMRTYYLAGQTLYVIIVLGIFYMFLRIYRPRYFGSPSHITFLTAFVTLFTVLAIVLFEGFTNGIYLTPFAAVPVIILIFFDSRTAIFALGATVMLCVLVATFQFQFIFMQLAVGLAATFSIHQLSRRSQLLRTALIAFVIYALTYLASLLIGQGDLTGFSWRTIGMFAINSVILSFAYVLIFVIEKVFGFTSTVTLVELSDINNPLLRRLAETAPGTFQHSMQVSTLAAEAARAIGANTQLVRTGALYHDIGKMQSPIFFTENQHGVNPHTGLEPQVSAKKIISHVTDGLSMAAKEKLPGVIRDFISQHHGRGLTRYFYTTAVNASPDGQVDPTPFRYPGPNPQSKETAILMMADAVEAASRSLKDYSQQSIDALVDKIIDQQQADGLYNDSPISFADLGRIKDTFKKRLATIYHTRVAYPDAK